MFVDEIGALVPHGAVEREPTGEGPLSGLRFALKDLFHLAGVATSAGNPDWLNSHEIPSETAPVPTALLAAGARLTGKTITDEIAWSLNGENFHYGTPRNVAAPGRIPGGSSSGSAAAVAAGLVDFAIGTDTGGSVRLPASYCGLIGLRPTHGRISIDGAVALAPSYDTVGWFARDLGVFERVGRVLLGEPQGVVESTRLIVADDMWARARPETGDALQPALKKLTALFGRADHVEVSGARGAAWRDVFRVIQSAEAWELHGEWASRVRPAFGPGVKERFEAASKLSGEETASAKALREKIRAEMEALLPPGVVLVSPTVPGIAPLIGTPEPELNVFRAAALEMLSPAGHAGLPQISLPMGVVDGCPVGLSLVAARGQDEALIALAAKLLG